MENFVERVALWVGVVVLAAVVVILFQHATGTSAILDTLTGLLGAREPERPSAPSSVQAWPQLFPADGQASYAARQAVQSQLMPDVGAPLLYLAAPINPGYKLH